MQVQEKIQLPVVQMVQEPTVSESVLGSYDTSNVEGALQKWLSNARSVENNFFGVVVYALEQFQKKNNTPLTALVAITSGKEWKGFKLPNGAVGVTQFKAPLQRILAKCLVNSTLTFKEGKAKWKVTHNGGVIGDELDKLRQLVNDGLTAKSKKFAEVFPAAKFEKSAQKEVMAKVVESLLAKAVEDRTDAEQKVVESALESAKEAKIKYAKTVLKALEDRHISVDEFIGFLKSKDI